MTSFQHNRHNSANLLAGQSSTFARIGIGVRDAHHELEVSGIVHLSAEQSGTPAAPVNGDGGVFYTKADGKPYWRSNDVAEVALTNDTNTTYSAGNGLALSSTTLSICDPATLGQLTESTDATDDKILLWDETASVWKYMTLDDLQDSIDTGGGGGEANEMSFKTISVSGQSDVVADADDDTLTLAAGANVAITTNAGTDTITIASTDTNTQLTTEAVQDIVGAMFSSNTETRCTVTYQDADGTIDVEVDDLDTNLTTEAVQDIVGAMFSGNTETRISATYEDGDGTIDLAVDDMTANTQLTQEQVEDYAGALVASGGTKTGISVTYQDGTGDMDFVVADLTVASDGGSTGMTPGDTLTIAGGTNCTTATSGDTLTINATDTNTQLSTEQVQDIVGAMFSSNTETRCTVTYEDGDGTIDVVVDDMTADTQLTTEAVQDIVGAMFSSNTETRCTVTYEDGDGTIDVVVDDMTANTQLTQEQVEDYAGALVASGGTKTGIAVTYQDGTGDMDFVVSDLTVTGDSGSTGMTPGDTLTIAGGTNITTAMSGDTLTINQSGGGEENESSFKTISVSGQDDVVADADDDTLTLAAGSNVTITTTAGTDTITFASADTNTQLSTEQVQDIVGAMFSSNTETRCTVTYQEGDGTIDVVVDDMTADTQLTTEAVQDIVGAMFTSNTETRITATYEDGDGTIDLVVTDMTADTQLTTEQVQDIVGGMLTGNTETRIAVTYEDGDGTIDFVVDDMSGGGGSGDVEAGSTFTTAGVIMACDGDDKTIDEPNATLTTNGQGMTVSSAASTPFQANSSTRDGNSTFKFTTGSGDSGSAQNNQSSVQVIAQTSANANLYLGDTDSPTRGGLKYKNNGDSMQLVAAGAAVLELDSGKVVEFKIAGGSKTVNLLNDAMDTSMSGSATVQVNATEWLEIKVNGNTRYIPVWS